MARFRWAAIGVVVACGGRTGLDVIVEVDASHFVDASIYDAAHEAAPLPDVIVDVGVDVPPLPKVCTELALVSDLEVSGLVVDTDWVYFTTFSGLASLIGVGRVSKWGGPYDMFSPKQGFSPVVDATHLYWIDDGGNIVRTLKSGGSFVEYLGNSFFAVAIALDAANVYAVDSQTNELWSMPKSGGSGTKLASTVAPGDGIAVDGTDVYIATNAPGPNGGIEKTTTSGAGLEVLALAMYSLSPLVDGTNVYWVHEYPFAEVLTVGKDGGAVTVLGGQGTAAYSTQSIAIDAANVYWPHYNNVYKTPKVGGPVTVVTQPPNGAAAVRVAVDECLFYAHGGFGSSPPPQIIRVPK